MSMRSVSEHIWRREGAGCRLCVRDRKSPHRTCAVLDHAGPVASFRTGLRIWPAASATACSSAASGISSRRQADSRLRQALVMPRRQQCFAASHLNPAAHQPQTRSQATDCPATHRDCMRRTRRCTPSSPRARYRPQSICSNVWCRMRPVSSSFEPDQELVSLSSEAAC